MPSDANPAKEGTPSTSEPPIRPKKAEMMLSFGFKWTKPAGKFLIETEGEREDQDTDEKSEKENSSIDSAGFMGLDFCSTTDSSQQVVAVNNPMEDSETAPGRLEFLINLVLNFRFKLIEFLKENTFVNLAFVLGLKSRKAPQTAARKDGKYS